MSFVEKMPSWLRYIIAIPIGIICLYLVYYVGYFSNLFIASPDSPIIKIYVFLYSNGINVLVMTTVMNFILPKHKFSFTLILAIIFCSLGMIGVGMNIVTGTLTVKNAIGLLLTILAFIYACYNAFEQDREET